MLPFPPNATQLVGLAMFGAASAGCLAVARVVPVRSRRAWLVLALLQGLMAGEVLCGWRHDLHDVVNQQLETWGVYSNRDAWQPLLVAMTFVLGLVAGVRAWWSTRADRFLSRAVLATAAAVILFAIESISLHAVDAVLYARLGPLLCVGWLWLVLGVAACWPVAAALSRGRGGHSLRE